MSNQLISVFTPCNKLTFINDLYNSLRKQTYGNWQWVLMLNGDPSLKQNLPEDIDNDSRVKVLFYAPPNKNKDNIGLLKSKCVKNCDGEFIVELDHDDFLTDNALEVIVSLNADFCYSDCYYVFEEKSKKFEFSKLMGWDNRYINNLYCPKSPLALAANIRSIHYAPNHVRAFKKSAYNEIGGYDESLNICDDLDLIQRMYQKFDLSYIPQPLYYYRIHSDNSWNEPSRNTKIQQKNIELYWNNIEKIYNSKPEKNSLHVLDFTNKFSRFDKICDEASVLGSKAKHGDLIRLRVFSDSSKIPSSLNWIQLKNSFCNVSLKQRIGSSKSDPNFVYSAHRTISDKSLSDIEILEFDMIVINQETEENKIFGWRGLVD